jgi:hypothetical protein
MAPEFDDELYAEAALELEEVIHSGRSAFRRFETRQQFFRYLQICICGHLTGYMRKTNWSAVQHVDPSTVLSDYPDQREIRARVYMGELPKEIYRIVSTKLRFNGKEREACNFILKSLLSYKPVSPATIRYHFKLREAEFFIDHVKVLIRSVLYYLRERLPASFFEMTFSREQFLLFNEMVDIEEMT